MWRSAAAFWANGHRADLITVGQHIFGMEEEGPGAVTNALDTSFCNAIGMVCTYTTVGEFLMLSVAIVLESFLVKSAVITSVALDCDTMSSGNAFISMFGGNGGLSSRGV